MTLRLSDIGARIDSVEQLGAVVNAMRGIAAARAQQARSQVEAVDSYASTIEAAIGRAVALMPPQPSIGVHSPAGQTLVVFAAEQGFAGAFSERVFAALGNDLAASQVFLVGTRGMAAIAGRGIDPEWQGAMPSHSAGIPKLANQICEALYEMIAIGEIVELEVVFSQWEPGNAPQIQRVTLLPLDFSSFPSPKSANPPLHYLAPADLLAGLAGDYLHAQLCHAALHAFAAENEARKEAMAAARNQVVRQLADLRNEERVVRQEEITAEVVELAAGTSARRA